MSYGRAAEFEGLECSTADQEVEAADTLLQTLVGSTLQVVGMVEPIGSVELVGTVELVGNVHMEQAGVVKLVGGIVLLIAEESYILFPPSLFFHPCKNTLRDFCTWRLGHILTSTSAEVPVWGKEKMSRLISIQMQLGHSMQHHVTTSLINSLAMVKWLSVLHGRP